MLRGRKKPEVRKESQQGVQSRRLGGAREERRIGIEAGEVVANISNHIGGDTTHRSESTSVEECLSSNASEKTFRIFLVHHHVHAKGYFS